MFRIIWVHLWLFGCATTLSVKRVKLVKNFVPWSPIGIVRNERTRSTPLDPKLMFWCVSYYLGAFGTVFCPTTLSANRVNWCNCSCHKVALEFFATNAPDPPHWTLNFCFHAICTILLNLGLFGCLTKLGAKRERTGAKVHATKSHQNFSERTHPIHPIGS